MKKSVYLIFGVLMCCCFEVNAQKAKNNPFQMVDVPDSISYKLENAYRKSTGFGGVNAGKNVWNLLNAKDFGFKNGIYSFKGQGPHFPRLIFIYNNGKLYTFTSSSVNQVLEEYIDCIKLLGLSEPDRIRYLKVIANYLQDELGSTYGAEVR